MFISDHPESKVRISVEPKLSSAVNYVVNKSFLERGDIKKEETTLEYLRQIGQRKAQLNCFGGSGW